MGRMKMEEGKREDEDGRGKEVGGGGSRRT